MFSFKRGYTTGVFDLFHVGHLDFLLAAKSQCQYLIVGVCVDSLVFEHKNRFPIIPLGDRLKIIENIGCVDEVIVQTTVSKLYDWQRLDFDVVFHGNDAEGSDLETQNQNALKPYNIPFIYIPRKNDISTTKIINAIVGGK